MCRLVAVELGSPGRLRLARLLLEALHKAAARDVLRPGGPVEHCDGAGLLVAAETRDGMSVTHRLAGGTCGENLEALRRFSSLLVDAAEGAVGRILVVAHARRASPGMPRGPEYSHPVRVPVELRAGRGDLFIAHNGTLDREALALLAGISDEGETDTRLMARIVADRIRGLSLGEAAERGREAVLGLRKYVRSALVTIGVVAGPVGYAWFHTSCAVKYPDYYLLVPLTAPGVRALASPTVAYYLESRGLRVGDPVRDECPRAAGGVGLH